MNDAPGEPAPPAGLPSTFERVLEAIPKHLVPSTLKALDRLIGGAADIPAAWLAQKKAQIDAQTEAFRLVEGAIARTAAAEAGADTAIVGRAVEVLVRKAYREQRNREAVGIAAVEELRTLPSPEQPQTENSPKEEVSPPDEEWLNVFEQYAERASTERMQTLWGRVLAGEIRRPGQFGMRTLRFLSEFSQADAEKFSLFAQSSFGDAAPKSLVRTPGDIRPLIDLEAAGLISGATGVGLTRTVTFSELGFSFQLEGNLVLILEGEPNARISYEVIPLTALGQELLALVADRDARQCARKVAQAIRKPEIKSASLVVQVAGQGLPIEVFWNDADASNSGLSA